MKKQLTMYTYMLKKFILTCFCLFSFHALHAKVLPLDTGRMIFDRYRNVEIDIFDYTYLIKSTDQPYLRLQLEDDSLWQVVPMNSEANSFYEQENFFEVYFYPFEVYPHPFEGTVFNLWQPGDILIFHKIVDRPSLLAYNVTKNLVLDLLPVEGPAVPQLYIKSVTNTNDTYFYLVYNKKTRSYDQQQGNYWRVIIILSDGSIWEDQSNRPLINWNEGDPVHVSKDTPYRSNNTHILMNFRSNKTGEYKRLGVFCAN